MPRLPLSATLVAAALAAATPAQAQVAVRLRFLPTVGQVTHYRNTVQTWMQIPGMPAADTAQPVMAMTLYMTRKITARHGGLWTSTFAVDSSQLGGVIAASMSQDMFRGLMIRQVMNSLGRTDSTDVMPAPNTNPTVAEALRRAGGLGRSNMSLPVRPVRVGESWTDSTTMTIPAGSMQQAGTVRVTYRLERLERQGGDRVAVITSETAIDTRGAGNGLSATGTSKGEVRLDLDASQLLSATTDVTMSIRSASTTIPSRSHYEIVIVH